MLSTALRWGVGLAAGGFTVNSLLGEAAHRARVPLQRVAQHSTQAAAASTSSDSNGLPTPPLTTVWRVPQGAHSA